MAEIGKALRTHLLTKTAITDLVSTRIYPDVLPQGVTLPAVTYQHIFEQSNNHLGGSENTGETTVQFDVYASTRSEANTAAEAIRKELDNLSGTLSSIWFDSVLPDIGRHRFESSQDADDSGHRYVTSRDYTCIHAEEAVNT